MLAKKRSLLWISQWNKKGEKENNQQSSSDILEK